MAKAEKQHDDARIAAAALRLAAAKGWERVTLDAVARAAKMPVAGLRARLVTVNALVPMIAKAIDHEAFVAVGAGGAGPLHDRLFDLLMARFDILQKHRQAIESMESAARHDRALACVLMRAVMDGAYRVIDAARVDSISPPRAVVAMGLVAIYAYAFCAWRADDSRDMAKTMAALDKALRWAGKTVALVTKS
ncbi:MAG: TetR family transcriptional regulator [Alphaproteobacteria bacterium]|nr:TetR family transcriptional regulator [Alphaproteobacteria bacterium]